VAEPIDLYSDNSETIEAVLAHVRRRHLLSPDAAEEFSSWARLRLIEDDGAILRKFRGQSTLRTYLTTVLVHLFLDWRNAQWGRWRPTALARRLGPLAIELERLVLRDGRDYDEAVEMLLSIRAAASRAQCDELWAQLKRQPTRKMTSTDALADVPSPEESHAQVDFESVQQKSDRVAAALRRSLRSLDSHEQIILRLCYVDRFTAKQIGAVLHLEAKPLYRRIEQIEAKLGALLVADGLSKEEVLELFRAPGVDLGEILDEELRKPKAGPSITENAGGVV
jgi:RNA polymerase sigma factor (sigma-70 family)